jgi:hypothetical protein
MNATSSFGRSSLRGWRLWLLLLVLAEICWFGLLYPLTPKSWLAALVEFALPVALAAYTYLIVRALIWLGGRPLSAGARRLIGVTLAVSVGVFVLLLVYVAQRILPAGFGRGLATSWLDV